MVARQDYFFFFFFVLEGGPLNLEPLIPELQLHRYSVFLFFFFLFSLASLLTCVFSLALIARLLNLCRGPFTVFSNTVTTATRHGSVCNFLSRQASYFAYQQYNSSSSAATISKRSCCNAKQLTVRMTPPHWEGTPPWKTLDWFAPPVFLHKKIRVLEFCQYIRIRYVFNGSNLERPRRARDFKNLIAACVNFMSVPLRNVHI